jgi:hypothetical protein
VEVNFMARTAVGLFLDRRAADDAIRELEADGFARQDIRVVGEALGMSEPGTMSIAHTEFEVNLIRVLRSIGATEKDAECYVEGLRRGGVIVFAAAPDEKADEAIEIMNHHNPAEIEELKATAPHLASEQRAIFHDHRAATQSGRVSVSGSGARLFVW